MISSHSPKTLIIGLLIKNLTFSPSDQICRFSHMLGKATTDSQLNMSRCIIWWFDIFLQVSSIDSFWLQIHFYFGYFLHVTPSSIILWRTSMQILWEVHVGFGPSITTNTSRGTITHMHLSSIRHIYSSQLSMFVPNSSMYRYWQIEDKHEELQPLHIHQSYKKYLKCYFNFRFILSHIHAWDSTILWSSSGWVSQKVLNPLGLSSSQ